MSEEYCWECEESYSRNEVFDIPVFNKGYTIKWCLNCAIKQLQWTDYRLIQKPEGYKRFKIKSMQDDMKEWRGIVDELILCFEGQFRKLKKFDYTWEELHALAIEIQYQEKFELAQLTGENNGH